jgi:hypothetical protein
MLPSLANKVVVFSSHYFPASLDLHITLMPTRKHSPIPLSKVRSNAKKNK